MQNLLLSLTTQGWLNARVRMDDTDSRILLFTTTLTPDPVPGHVVTINAAGSHRFHIGGLTHSPRNQSKNLRSSNSDPPEA